jgi:hypothetical protein
LLTCTEYFLEKYSKIALKRSCVELCCWTFHWYVYCVHSLLLDISLICLLCWFVTVGRFTDMFTLLIRCCWTLTDMLNVLIRYCWTFHWYVYCVDSLLLDIHWYVQCVDSLLLDVSLICLLCLFVTVGHFTDMFMCYFFADSWLREEIDITSYILWFFRGLYVEKAIYLFFKCVI